ncbi:MAG: hypothetical protein AAF607_11940 [Pseudomonadota bacterium]
MSMATGSSQVDLEDLRKTVSLGREPEFSNQPGNDQLLEMVLALSAEVSVLRDRLDAHERLADAGALATPQAIDEYEPTETVSQQRSARRARFLAKLFRPLRQAAARDLFAREQARDADLKQAAE